MGKSGSLEGARSANQIQGLGSRSDEKMKEKINGKYPPSVMRDTKESRVWLQDGARLQKSPKRGTP